MSGCTLRLFSTSHSGAEETRSSSSGSADTSTPEPVHDSPAGLHSVTRPPPPHHSGVTFLCKLTSSASKTLTESMS
ncbi:unnamed protein product [Pleuronectes platessa]|uniref:Uncharacterized protein n=1 Tax=Pleuronectes platessa TaxID=8262 RepID=A0A9N7TK29_PLEPL|nr:unnamed protein product [Pleuronectes platessa]